MATMTKAQKADRDMAIDRLRQLLKPGDTIRCVLRSVARSGMSRHIDFYHFGPDGSESWLSGLMGTAMGIRRAKDDSLVVSGCGMDMGFHVVSNLSYTLYPDGFVCAGDNCPSNHHSNSREPEAFHKEAGYAFRSRWI